MPYKNPEDQKAAAHRHYERNKPAMKRRARLFSNQARERNRKFIDDYLADHPCVDCGEADLIVLEFDHVRGHKKATISTMVINAVGLDTLKKEVKKCEIRCANCHRRVTRKRELKK